MAHRASLKRTLPVRRQTCFLMRSFLLFCCFWLPLQVSAALAEDMPYGQGLLWQVSRDGVPLAHLFGTMHVTDQRVLQVPEPVADSLAQADRAVFEIVPSAADRQAMSLALLLRDGRRLDGIVGRELFDQAARLAVGYGLPREALGQLKPWALMPILSVPPEEFARKATGTKALDEALQERAQRLGKPLLALETIEEQLAIFDGLSEADQTAMLEEVVKRHGETLATHNRMKELYLDGDLAGIYRLMLDQSAGNDLRLARAFEQRAVIERNRLMTQRLQPLLDGGALFVAVGALHLPGRDGILHLLAARGYDIQRVF